MKETAKSSLGQLPALHKYLLEQRSFFSVFDFGAGKYGKTDQAYAETNLAYYPYDPYNRDAASNEHNVQCLKWGHCSILACANVLNVVPDEDLQLVINKLYDFTTWTKQKTCYVSVYYNRDLEQDRSTSYGGYQRNKPLAWYIPKLEGFFDSVKKEKNFLVCKP